jgi:DNA mismatch endonuclease (patch repair protein)
MPRRVKRAGTSVSRDVSRAARSRIMSAIKGGNTGPERMVRTFLHGHGFRYGLHRKDLPGRPDLVLPKWGAVIFVHGCFWHYHQHCSFANMPVGNRDFWREKLLSNRKRDRTATALLREDGWRVAVVWDCALKANPKRTLARLATWLPSRRRYLELRD